MFNSCLRDPELLGAGTSIQIHFSNSSLCSEYFVSQNNQRPLTSQELNKSWENIRVTLHLGCMTSFGDGENAGEG